MSQIKHQIEQIIAKRKSSRLPLIETKIAFVESLLQRVNSLDSLVREIKMQCEAKKGPYYAILASDPGMEMRLQNVSTDDTRAAISELQKELARLKVRFSRTSISLQVFGMAGSEKSTFIQSVTGLGNDVVLASEGDHCTGVSSFIYNSDHFEARVFLYTEDELLALFNKNLEALEKAFNPVAEPVLLRNFHEILDFKLENAGLPAALEDRLSVMKYVENFSLIGNLISGRDAQGLPLSGLKRDADGRSYIEITDPSQVQQWVAQHNGYSTSDPRYKAYKCYLAVDRVDIYNKFLCEDAGDIVLMDNVGLGDPTNDLSTEQHMYQAIADNSDAVILLYMPKPNCPRGEFAEINKRLNNIRFKNVYQGVERMDVHELYLLLNKRNTPGYNNTGDCDDAVTTFRGPLYERKETILIANAADKESTRKDAIEPILAQLMEHLDNIDVRMLENVNVLGDRLYSNYSRLADAVAKVVSGTMKANSSEGKLFDVLFKQLNYSSALRDLDESYAEDKDYPCEEVKDRIDEVIDKLIDLVPKPERIYPDVERGDNATNTIFVKYLNEFRNRVFEAFEEVNTDVLIPLQEKVKDDLIQILFNQARLGNIPLQGYSLEEGPSQAWLKCLVSEKIDIETYPKLYDMLTFILSYSISIEGLIEYNVAKCLESIDPMNASCSPMPPSTLPLGEQAEEIWEEIINRTTPLQKDMRLWRDSFSLIPSHSFYARVHKFRDKMVFGDETAKDNIRDFYRENRLSVWREDFANMVVTDQAFGTWNKESKALLDLCVKNSFYLKLDA